MDKKYNDLINKYTEIAHLNKAGTLLYWDQSVMMPENGNDYRNDTMATLDRICQLKTKDKSYNKLINEVHDYYLTENTDLEKIHLLKKIKKDQDKAIKIPLKLSEEMLRHSNKTYNAWIEAKKQNSFTIVEKYLEKSIDLSKEYAELFPEFTHPADAIIDDSDHGFSVEKLKVVFSDLANFLEPFIKKIGEKSNQNTKYDKFLKQQFNNDKQLKISTDLAKIIGYDFKSGRLDLSEHPYTIDFNSKDVRITTRVKNNDFNECLFSVLHEAGHGMYEQNINPDFDFTPFSGGVSSGVHESQSRLWENIVGRSKNFWKFNYAKIQNLFPEQFKNISLDDFYKAVNIVEPSLIRTDADEVTYNMHIIIRFELEIALLEGKIKVRDLPELWNEKYKKYLGVTPSNLSEGVLQDIHWYDGLLGGNFQGYSIGNIMSSGFMEAAMKNEDVKNGINEGDYHKLQAWLKENLYQHGSYYEPDFLYKKVTGEDLNIRAYQKYLTDKFSDIYGL